MNFNVNQTLNNFLAAAALVGSAACVLALPVQAQQVYRIVGACFEVYKEKGAWLCGVRLPGMP